MVDPLSQEQRSAHMAKVRSKGNKSTEVKVEGVLIEKGITGWTKHPAFRTSSPDFYFEDHKLAVFIDGCFWHACPKCKRNTPSTRSEFWKEKIDANRRRDNRNRRKMRMVGYHVMRIWEHELKTDKWISRLQGMLKRTGTETDTREDLFVV